MSGAVDRENQIFDVLHAFNEAGLDFVVVGGYAVSAYQHRFSVDADLVIPEAAVDAFVDVLTDRGFEEIVDRDLMYGGRFIGYQKDAALPVTVDLLVGSLTSRQTDASWSYEYFAQHAEQAEIQGSEKSVEVRIPDPELLVAVKLHSGRLTDARDAVALATELEPDKVATHLDRGDPDKLQQVLAQVRETVRDDDFEDAFKGEFSQQQLPDENIHTILDLIQSQVDR